MSTLGQALRGPNRGIRIRAAAGISLTRVIPSTG